jgi:hypothetical protein
VLQETIVKWLAKCRNFVFVGGQFQVCINCTYNGKTSNVLLFSFVCVSFVFSSNKTQTLRYRTGETYSLKKKRIPSIFKDESTGSCICLWKLAVAVATYVSICIV